MNNRLPNIILALCYTVLAIYTATLGGWFWLATAAFGLAAALRFYTLSRQSSASTEAAEVPRTVEFYDHDGTRVPTIEEVNQARDEAAKALKEQADEIVARIRAEKATATLADAHGTVVPLKPKRSRKPKDGQ